MLNRLARLIVLFAVVAHLVIGVPLQALARTAPAPATHHVVAAGHGEHHAIEHHAMTHERHGLATDQCAAMHPSGEGGEAAGDCTCAIGLCAAVLGIMPTPAVLVWGDATVLSVPHGVSLYPNTIHPPLRPPRV